MRSGRPRNVSFPIERTEVVHGRDQKRIVEENTAVNCLRCRSEFLINGDTTHVMLDYECDEPVIRCPHCGYRVALYLYYAQTEKIQRVRRRAQMAAERRKALENIEWQKETF